MSDAPHPDVVARLLAERYPIRADEKLVCHVDEAAGRLGLELWDPRHRYTISVRYEGGAEEGESPWMHMADALDALFGALIESDRDYRQLPTGAGVAHEGATFEVDVHHDLPEVTKLANQMLEGN